MADIVNIVFVGATGYLGGTVYDRLLKHPQASRLQITAYVRSEEKARKCEAAGLRAIFGSLAILEEAVEHSSVIFNTASSDDLPLTQAILDGAKKRYSATGIPPVLIHTSGTGIIADQSMGERASDTVYDDMDHSLKDIPVERWHRNVDVPLAKAHDEGYIRSYIVAPPFIWGLATGRLVDAGLQNPVTTGVLALSRIAIARGRVSFIGPQLNTWSTVEVNELADLQVTIFNAAFFDDNIAGGNAYYFAANGDVAFKDVLTLIAKALYKHGLLKTDQTDQLSSEDLAKWPILTAFAINSRVTDTRSRSLGWKPTKTPEDLLDDIDESIRVISTQNSDFGASWCVVNQH